MRFTTTSSPFSVFRSRLARVVAAAALALTAGATIADRPSLPAGAREDLPKDRLLPVPFPAGEKLVYTVSWLKIEGGEMTIAASRDATPDGVPVHHIALAAVSNDYVSKFYPVNTRYETWVDARDFQPLRFEKRAREGRYVSDEVETFDLARHVGLWRDTTTTLPERVSDIISCFYWLRTQPMSVGAAIKVDMFSRGKVYKIVVNVLGEERVETEAGAFDTWKVQPEMRETPRDEDRNKGKLFLWFSKDARRLPVMARTVMPIGSVTGRLRRVEVPGTTAGPS